VVVTHNPNCTRLVDSPVPQVGTYTPISMVGMHSRGKWTMMKKTRQVASAIEYILSAPIFVLWSSILSIPPFFDTMSLLSCLSDVSRVHLEQKQTPSHGAAGKAAATTHHLLP
jgi:hypothetical protein